MKTIFSILLGMVCATYLIFAVSGCEQDKKDDNAAPSYTVTFRGVTYEFDSALFIDYKDLCHFGGSTKNVVLNAHGVFPTSWLGKTTDIEGPFFMTFDPSWPGGNSFNPIIKNGTVKITEVKGGLHIVVDAVEDNGELFKMDVLAKAESVSNTLTLRGSTLNITSALYFRNNLDFFAGEENEIKGFGTFESDWVGKTTVLWGPFFMSFNPMEGNSIVPVIKTGTVKITEMEDVLHVLVDAVEEDGQKFKIDVLAERTS